MQAGRAHGQARGRRLDRAEIVRFLVERGIPVCAHLGFTPQSVHALGGYRVQGRDDEAAADAAAAGRRARRRPAPRCWCSRWCRRRSPRESLTKPCAIPTIGIGAGGGCSGQVLVLHDMLGLRPAQAALRAQLHGRQRRHRRRPCGATWPP